MIRLALIGCGRHCRREHAPSMAMYKREHPKEIELAATCDIDLDRARAFKEEYGFSKAYADISEMLDSERIDACVCVMAVPNIREVAVDLMRRGMPCTVEKPPGASLAEAKQLAAVAAETDSPHMVSVDRRFMPRLNQAVAWARRCGPVQYVRSTVCRRSRREPAFIWSTSIHMVDALRHVAGEVADYTATVHTGKELAANWYEISFEFENACRGYLELLPTAGMQAEVYQLFGEDYRVIVEAPVGCSASIRCWKGGELVVDETAPDDEEGIVQRGSYFEIVELVEALKQGRPPGPTIAQVLPSLEICFAIARQAGVVNDS